VTAERAERGGRMPPSCSDAISAEERFAETAKVRERLASWQVQALTFSDHQPTPPEAKQASLSSKENVFDERSNHQDEDDQGD
jgi:hypothetical protein